VLLSGFEACRSDLLLRCTKCLEVSLSFVYNAAFGPILGRGL
jgi:hypothetical protein